MAATTRQRAKGRSGSTFFALSHALFCGDQCWHLVMSHEIDRLTQRAEGAEERAADSERWAPEAERDRDIILQAWGSLVAECDVLAEELERRRSGTVPDTAPDRIAGSGP